MVLILEKLNPLKWQAKQINLKINCMLRLRGELPLISFRVCGIFFHLSLLFFLAPMQLIELDAHFLLLGYDNCQFFILIENVVHDFT